MYSAVRLALQSMIDDGTYLKILTRYGLQSGAVASTLVIAGPPLTRRQSDLACSASQRAVRRLTELRRGAIRNLSATVDAVRVLHAFAPAATLRHRSRESRRWGGRQAALGPLGGLEERE